MKSTILKNARIINEQKDFIADLKIENELISEISTRGIVAQEKDVVIECSGKILIPGIVDDQVHFREPGLTHKANIATESKAALAGGVTSFMEMPNVNPLTLTHELLEEKFAIASTVSPVNFSFFLGAGHANIEEIKKMDPNSVCGVKIFMGSSTGDMLVDDDEILRAIFTHAPSLIATHCEDEPRVKQRTAEFVAKYGPNITPEMHAEIRDIEACYLSSSKAKKLAEECNSRLHILHITTARELELFSNSLPLEEKKLTAEVCVHHLHFTSDDYQTLGNLIKCNPAIKEPANKEAIWKALLTDVIDIIATDHAPHTWQEKQNPYINSPSGLPLVQHSLQLMCEYVLQKKLAYTDLVNKMCHSPALCFKLQKRGFIREGYYADLVLIDPSKTYTVSKENILYKCGWSPFEGQTFGHTIDTVWVNGYASWQNNMQSQFKPGKRLEFGYR